MEIWSLTSMGISMEIVGQGYAHCNKPHFVNCIAPERDTVSQQHVCTVHASQC
jgi:hypothetical protein